MEEKLLYILILIDLGLRDPQSPDHRMMVLDPLDEGGRELVEASGEVSGWEEDGRQFGMSDVRRTSGDRGHMRDRGGGESSVENSAASCGRTVSVGSGSARAGVWCCY